MGAEELEYLDFADSTAWELWLSVNAESSQGVWLRIGKANKNKNLIGIRDAGDSALCFGWIDSHRRAFDELSFLQRYSPRKPKGSWSMENVERVEALISLGKMRAGGQREIDAARKDGRWQNAYPSQSAFTVPDDFHAVLATHPNARAAFEDLRRSAQYTLLLPVFKAQGAKQRDSRIQKAIVELSELPQGSE